MNIEKNLTDDQYWTIWTLLHPEEREEAIDKTRGYISREQIHYLKNLAAYLSRHGRPDLTASIRRLISARCQLN